MWTEEEDEELRGFVAEYGVKKWAFISTKMSTGKGAKQCRRRWQNYLNNDLKQGGWTEEEDQRIRAVLTEGKVDLVALANKLGRTVGSVKVRIGRLRESCDWRFSAPSCSSTLQPFSQHLVASESRDQQLSNGATSTFCT